MTIALRAPHLVGALIPVDNAPVDAVLKSDFYKYLEGMQEIQNAAVKRQAQADEILSKYENALPVRQFLLTNLVKKPQSDVFVMRIPLKTLASNLGKLGDFPFRNPHEACYKGPTLFVRGTKSHYVADDVLPAVGQFFPRFVVTNIDCGHWVISEQPEAFRQAVVTFLKDLDKD
ncbi:MAG: hypothetical protein LQ350_001121 [Teloschistes chrysophthalmus]|nr:MAG: hypothetical protein LQ350_001121 [Niorma chrysophthalma]